MIDSVLNFKRRLGHGLLGGSVVLGLVLGGTLIPTDTEAAFLNIVKGHVYTRGLVRGPNGQPILAAYAEDGSFVREHGEMTGEWEDANIMSAERFNALVQAFEDYKTQHADGIARGARLMSRDAYEGGPLHGQSRIRLEEDTRSVYVRGERTLYTDETEPLLFQSPLNLMLYAGGGPLDGSIKSVLVSDDGELLIRSPHHLGFWVSYTQQGEGECTDQTAVDPAEDSRLLNLYEEERPCAPVAGAQVEAFSAVTGDTYAYTDNTGQFNLTILNPLCPGFYFEYTNIVFLKMFYSDFNPKREGMDLFFAEPRYTYAGCNGYGPHPLVPNLAPQPAVSNTRFPVDVIALTGAGRINNRGVVPGAEPLPFGETTHRTDLPVFTEQAPVDLDLDADGLPDKAILHEGTVYVYLGGRNIEFDDSGAPVNEDLTRLPDQMAEGFPDANDHEGLLSQISEEDLQQTDLYIYRVATGERIGELRGLKENEFRDGLLEDGWSYRTLLATGFNPESRKQIGWRNRAEIDDKRLEREADHLRIGEQIKLVAINRRTGYIGTQTIELKAAEGGRIDFPVPEIELRPPNLQITAERHYQVESGLTQGEERNYIIGFEGSGLTSDQYIAITTEWFDHDGTPLPNDLPGYTGRLAQVVAENTLGSSRVGHFEIKPGRRLQLVALNGTDIQNKHYYVHVAGYPSDENPDFETIGAGSGPLAHRPKYFVPIQVPIYNEKQSRAEQRAYRQQLEQYEEGLIAEKPIKPTPSYVFAYRPEMQFSVFDLKQPELQLQYEQEDQVQTIDLTDADPSEVAQILAEVDYVDIFYSAIGPDLPPLQNFGPDRELVLALGDREVEFTLNENGSVRLDNLDRHVALNPEDFLALQLYQNSDSANILWEYVITARLIQHSLAEVQRIPVETDTFNTELTVAELEHNAERARALAERFGVEEMSVEGFLEAALKGVIPEAVAADLTLGAIGAGYVGNFDDRYFYPNLGHKKLFVADECNNGEPMGENDQIEFAGAVFKGTNESVDGITVLPSESTSFQNGYAKFLLQGNGETLPLQDENGQDRPISLRFEITPEDPECKTYNQPVSLGEIIIKNNANTSVAEVLEGKGVFVQQNAHFTQNAFDNSNATREQYRRDGRSYGRQIDGRTVLEEQDQYLDYVQYMLNMIAIPLRTPVQESNIEYLITPDGKYGGDTAALFEALMEGGAHSIDDQDFGIKNDLNVISHYEGLRLHNLFNNPVEAIRNLGRLHLTFDKLRRDYQRNAIIDNIDQEIPANPFTDPPSISASELRYQVITPEALRGMNVIESVESNNDRYAENGAFIESNLRQLGIYQLFKNYDWDQDNLSNLAEVENATQIRASQDGAVTTRPGRFFNPINATDTGDDLKAAYNRGNVQVSGTYLDPNAASNSSSGLGEISTLDGRAVAGLRVPTIAPGLYDFPSGDNLNLDTHTTLRVLNALEAAGRWWAERYPDTYPLITAEEALAHNAQSRNEQAVSGALRFGINDISAPAGGPNRGSVCEDWPTRQGRDETTHPHVCTLGHFSHQNGTDMDIRYVSSSHIEQAYLVGSIGDEGLARTLELIDSMIDNGLSVNKVIMGDSLDDQERQTIGDSLPEVTAFSFDDGHNDHAHIRFSKDNLSQPSPESLQIVSVDSLGSGSASQNNLTINLGFTGDNEDSTYDITFRVNDVANNPLLPWTRLRFFVNSGDDIVDVTGVTANANGVLVDANTLWANIANQGEANHGQATLRIQCLQSELDSDVAIRLTDYQGRYDGGSEDFPVTEIGVLDINCQSQ